MRHDWLIIRRNEVKGTPTCKPKAKSIIQLGMTEGLLILQQGASLTGRPRGHAPPPAPFSYPPTLNCSAPCDSCCPPPQRPLSVPPSALFSRPLRPLVGPPWLIVVEPNGEGKVVTEGYFAFFGKGLWLFCPRPPHAEIRGDAPACSYLVKLYGTLGLILAFCEQLSF